MTNPPDALHFAVEDTANKYQGAVGWPDNPVRPRASTHQAANMMNLKRMPVGMRHAPSRRRRLNSSKEEPAPALAIGQEHSGGERG